MTCRCAVAVACCCVRVVGDVVGVLSEFPWVSRLVVGGVAFGVRMAIVLQRRVVQGDWFSAANSDENFLSAHLHPIFAARLVNMPKVAGSSTIVEREEAVGVVTH